MTSSAGPPEGLVWPDDLLPVVSELLWLFYHPLAAALMTKCLVCPSAVLTADESPYFVGQVACGTESVSSGIEVELGTVVRVLEPLPTALTELLPRFEVGLQCRGQLLAKAPFGRFQGAEAALATLKLTVASLNELDEARLYVSEPGRYCWEHEHCAGCGRQYGGSSSGATWTINRDRGPAGQGISFCTEACEARYAPPHLMPYPAQHEGSGH